MTADKNTSLLDKVLEGKDPEFQARVLDIVASVVSTNLLCNEAEQKLL